MAEKGCLLEVLLLYGPPNIGKTQYFNEHLEETYMRVSPSEVWNGRSTMTIRQIINELVIPKLRKGNNVVLDDQFRALKTRQSYISLIKSKVPRINFRCIVFDAQDGGLQLSVAHEYSLARNVRKGKISCKTVIDDWYDLQESPSVDEGVTVESKVVHLKCFSYFKLEVQGLFLEWDSIVKYKEGIPEISDGVAQSIILWIQTTPCGRVMVIQDPSSVPSSTMLECDTNMQRLLKQITKEVKCPVYGVTIETSVGFTKPPNPGILYFLQRLHNIDFASEKSAMIYQSTNFLKMSEAVGLRNIRASRIFQNPKAIKGSRELKPKIPPLLKHMKIIKPRGEVTYEAKIPLSENITNHTDRDGSVLVLFKLDNNRHLYVCANNVETVNRYNDLYKTNASPIDTSEPSRIAALGSEGPTDTGPPPLKKRKSASRGLPKWMQALKPDATPSPRRRKKVPLAFVSQESSSMESVPGKVEKGSLKPIPSLEYIMNEQELYETAQEIWKEAGRELPTEEEIRKHQEREESQTKNSHPPELLEEGRKPDDPVSNVSTGKDEQDDKSEEREEEKLTVVEENSNPDDPVSNVFTGRNEQDDKSEERDGEKPTIVEESPDLFVVPRQPPVRNNSSKSTRSTLSNVTHVSDSLVLNTSSFSSRSNPASSDSRGTVPESLVNDSAGRSPGPGRSSASTVPDSLVAASTNRSSGSISRQLSGSTVPDSFVSGTTSTSSRSSGPRPGSVTTVADSYVSDSCRSSRSRHGGSDNNSASTVPDSYVSGSDSEQMKRRAGYGGEHGDSEGVSPVTDSFVSGTITNVTDSHKSSEDSGDRKSTRPEPSDDVLKLCGL